MHQTPQASCPAHTPRAISAPPLRHLSPLTRPAFSLIELVISIAVVAVLIGLLLPLLTLARSTSLTTVCQNNLRQIGMGYQGYLQDHERFPGPDTTARFGGPEWNYGGVDFVGGERVPVVSASRPINAYLSAPALEDRERVAQVFHCPADRGVSPGTPLPGQPLTWDQGLAHVPLFNRFGTSYLANPALSDRSRALGPLAPREPVRLAELAVSTSRLLVAGDPVWHLATRETRAADDPAIADLSWHADRATGNMLAADGSVRFVTYDGPEGPGYTLTPFPVDR